MAAEITYVDPMVAPEVATIVSTLAFWLWPIVVTGVVSIIYWRTLRDRVAFLVLGTLMCFGIAALARSVTAYIFWTFITESTPQERIVVAFINQSLSATVAGILLSILPVAWLARILRHRHIAI